MPGFRDFNPDDAAPPCDEAGADLQLTYLGTAGFVLEKADRCLVLDPYVTRSSAWETLTHPLVPDAALIAQLIPRADEVLVGHAHYDHVLDAPVLCQQTGARLIGSEAVMHVARAAGVAEAQLCPLQGSSEVACGTWRVRSLVSRHGKAIFGRVPFPGDISAPPPWPPRVHQLRHGQVFNWWIDAAGFRLVHIDSADFFTEQLQGLQADIVCLCTVGRQHRPHYVRDVVEQLRPRYILPCHWDTMMTPIQEPAQLIPGVDLPGMVREIEAMGVIPLVTPLLGVHRFCTTAATSADWRR